MFKESDFTKSISEVYPAPPHLEDFFARIGSMDILEKIRENKDPHGALQELLGEVFGTWENAEKVLADMDIWIERCAVVSKNLNAEIKKELAQPSPDKEAINLLSAFAHNFHNIMLPFLDFHGQLQGLVKANRKTK